MMFSEIKSTRRHGLVDQAEVSWWDGIKWQWKDLQDDGAAKPVLCQMINNDNSAGHANKTKNYRKKNVEEKKEIERIYKQN